MVLAMYIHGLLWKKPWIASQKRLCFKSTKPIYEIHSFLKKIENANYDLLSCYLI